MEYEKCPICGSPSIIKEEDFEIYETLLIVDCYRCGIFSIDNNTLEIYKNKTKKKSNTLNKQIAIFSGWIRENQNVTITEEIINEFYSFKLPTLEHRATNLLKSFTDPYDLIGGRNVINFDNLERIIDIIELNEQKEYNDKFLAKDLKYMAVTWSYDIKELKFIYKDYLMGEKEYLEAIDKDFCKITPKGWAYLEEISRKNVSLHIVNYRIDYLIQKEEISNFPKTSQMIIDIKQTYERSNHLELSTLGHKCRELLQFFATEVIAYKKIEVRDKDITRIKNRINEILNSLKIGKTKPKFIERNYDYIDVLIDLVQRQEHAGTKENEVLIWNDARRIIIHCVMYIIDLIDLLSEYS